MIQNRFNVGDKVRLISFLNTATSPSGTNDKENYWKLIGLTGVIASNEKKTHPAFREMGERVLVKFDDDIDTFGLHCHTEKSNALWIFTSDLISV